MTGSKARTARGVSGPSRTLRHRACSGSSNSSAGTGGSSRLGGMCTPSAEENDPVSVSAARTSP
ncbi:hypothetical protein [Actinomadura madurae]|uniref:hypothetical protein n=1 Tax=Actinomadura madurae TaxID=1993 RepID=UPI0020D23395|nr:hypothetical protein [Actinomadura madurae]MCQ0016739.1 hypothetical protein [Actinomadura madurae]